jgi:hypothetical protein
LAHDDGNQKQTIRSCTAKGFLPSFAGAFLRDFAKAIEKLSRARFTYAANELLLW